MDQALGRADPQTAVFSCRQSGDEIAGQGPVGPAKHREFMPVEPGETFVGADPQESVRSLCDVPDRVGRQPFSLCPGCSGVLGYRLLREQSEGWESGQQEACRDQPKPADLAHFNRFVESNTIRL